MILTKVGQVWMPAECRQAPEQHRHHHRRRHLPLSAAAVVHQPDLHSAHLPLPLFHSSHRPTQIFHLLQLVPVQFHRGCSAVPQPHPVPPDADLSAGADLRHLLTDIKSSLQYNTTKLIHCEPQKKCQFVFDYSSAISFAIFIICIRTINQHNMDITHIIGAFVRLFSFKE